MAESTPFNRGDHPVLVPDAEERLAVAVIRSLGRAGYPVHTISSHPAPMGFGSRFVRHSARHPDYKHAEFLPWLRDYVKRHGIRCIVPGEDFLLAIRPVFAQFAPLLTSGSDAGQTYNHISKYALFRTLSDTHGAAGKNLPGLLLIDDEIWQDDAGELAALGAPMYVKTDAVHARSADGDSRVIRVTDVAEAPATIRQCLKSHDRVVVQGEASGVGIGAFLLRWNGQVIARFMHRRLHELPESGWSSYRTSWWHEAIMADAQAKLEALDFNGVAMLEYRWDPDTDRYSLLEMNARFWGSLHLALYTGVDFPRLLVDSFFGQDIEPRPDPVRTVRCRNLALETRYVAARLRDRDVRLSGKLRTIAEYIWLTLDPRVRSDLWFPGDRRVWWLQFRQFAATRRG